MRNKHKECRAIMEILSEVGVGCGREWKGFGCKMREEVLWLEGVLWLEQVLWLEEVPKAQVCRAGGRLVGLRCLSWGAARETRVCL